jgi:DNA-binding transcriptional regulator YiaG
VSVRVSLTTAEREYLMAAQAERKIPWKVLAHELGISMSELRYWRNGERRPTSDQVVRWWRAVSGGDER